MSRTRRATARLVAASAAATLAACAGERPPMAGANPGMDARPMQRESYRATFPRGGTPAQGSPANVPAATDIVPPNAPPNQPGNRP